LTYIEEINLYEAAPVELRLLETSVAVQRERADKLRDRIDELLEMAADGLKSARAKVRAEEGRLRASKQTSRKRKIAWPISEALCRS
jgi:hypothetical protein